MTRILTTIAIPRSIETVFASVTTPSTWPRWHPSSEGVVGDTDHSLENGEQVTEAFFVAGRRGQVTWTVRERVAPTRWVIEGVMTTGRGGGGTITYTFRPADGGTVFEREFVYSMPNPLDALVDFVILRHRVYAESTRALHPELPQKARRRVVE